MTHCSIIGYFIMLGFAPISWKTKKQPTVCRLLAEVGIRTMANATSEAIWI